MTSARRPHLERLRVEWLDRPLAVDELRPRFSWLLTGARDRSVQSRVRVVVRAARDGRLVADSGWLRTADPWWIPQRDLLLEAGSDCSWDVTVEVTVDDELDTVRASSTFAAGLLDETGWAGSAWIGAAARSSSEPAPAPLLRGVVELPDGIARARLHLAAGGFVHATLGGSPICDEVLGPGLTDFDARVHYSTHDVGRLLSPGENVLGLTLGRGFFGMTTSNVWGWHEAPWHAEPCVRALLIVELNDGTRLRFGTDAEFRSSEGPVRRDSLYEGETWDHRYAHAGWDRPGHDVSGWDHADTVAGPRGELTARPHPPIRVIDTLTGAVTQPTADETVFDFGRQVAGWARVRLPADEAELVIRYSERLDERGLPRITSIFSEGDFQRDQVSVSQNAPSPEWEQRFGYKGFRYVGISGWPGDAPGADDVHARAISADIERTARFTSSDDLLTWMHEAAVTTMRNNLHHIPTDTPVWEKNGWTGDAQLAADMLLRDLDSTSTLWSWLDSLSDSILADGRPALIAPDPGWRWEGHDESPPWNCALVLVPWRVYRATGDLRILSRHFPAIARYLRLEHSLAPDGISSTGLGDYLAPGSSGNPHEDMRVSATAYIAGSTAIAARIARLLGEQETADEFDAAAARIRSAFLATFFDPTEGVVRDETVGYRQTHNVLALEFGLVPADRQRDVAAALARDIDERCDGHLDVGALGVRRLLQGLSRNGQPDTAFRVATQRTSPSWGRWKDDGHSTMLEFWDDRRSRDHFFLGTVDDWLFADVAGVRLRDAGYRSVDIAPRHTRHLDSASATIHTVRGELAVEWERDGDAVHLSATIPIGTTATVRLPGVPERRWNSGRYEMTA